MVDLLAEELEQDGVGKEPLALGNAEVAFGRRFEQPAGQCEFVGGEGVFCDSLGSSQGGYQPVVEEVAAGFFFGLGERFGVGEIGFEVGGTCAANRAVERMCPRAESEVGGHVPVGGVMSGLEAGAGKV